MACRISALIPRVYDDYVLLRSWELLRDRQVITVPDEIEALVEATYAEDDRLPDETRARERWPGSRQAMDDDRANERRLAEVSWVGAPGAGPASHIARAPEVDDDDSQPATRLTLPTIEVVCVEAGSRENTYLDPRNDEVVFGYGHRPDRDLVKALLGSIPADTGQEERASIAALVTGSFGLEPGRSPAASLSAPARKWGSIVRRASSPTRRRARTRVRVGCLT